MDKDSTSSSPVAVVILVFIAFPFSIGYFLGEDKGREFTKIEFCKVIYQNTDEYIQAIDKPRPEILKELEQKIKEKK